MSRHVCTCIATVSIEKWKTTHTLCFVRHWQSLPSRGWFCSHATYTLKVLLTHNTSVKDGIQMLHMDTGLPNYIKWTTLLYKGISWLCLLIFIRFDHVIIRTSPVSISPSSVMSSSLLVYLALFALMVFPCYFLVGFTGSLVASILTHRIASSLQTKTATHWYFFF